MLLNKADLDVVKPMLVSYLDNYIKKCDKAILLSYSDELTKKIIDTRDKHDRAVFLMYAKLFTHSQTEPELVDELTEEDYRNLAMIFDYAQKQNAKLANEIFNITQDDKLYLKVKSEGVAQMEAYNRIMTFLKKVKEYRNQGLM